MALRSCPECGRQISETALFCPNCGYANSGTCGSCVHLVDTDDGGSCTPWCTVSRKDVSYKRQACISYIEDDYEEI